MAWSSVGSLGSATSQTASQATVPLTITAAVPVGDIAVVWFCVDMMVGGNNNVESSYNIKKVTDNKGNLWFHIGSSEYSPSGSPGDGVSVALFATQVKTALASSDVITGHCHTALNSSAVMAHRFAVAAGAGFQLQAYSVLGGQNQAPVATSLSGLPNQEYLFLHASGFEAYISEAYTEDADYTSVGSIGTSNATRDLNTSLAGGYRIATLTGDTINGSRAANSDNARVLCALKEVPFGDPLTIFGVHTPRLYESTSSLPSQVALSFYVLKPGEVAGMRFYKFVDGGTHIGHIYKGGFSNDQGSVTFASETSSGWQYQAFSSPVVLETSTWYYATMWSSAGKESVDKKRFYANIGNSYIVALNNGDWTNGWRTASAGATDATSPAAALYDCYIVDFDFTPYVSFEAPLLTLGPTFYTPTFRRYWTLGNTIGTTQNKTANSTSIAVTTTEAAAVGDILIVMVVKDNSTTTANVDGNEVSAVTGGGNTYTKLKEITMGGTGQSTVTIALYITQVTSAMASGATITATLGGTTTLNDSQCLSVTKITVPAGGGYQVFSSTGVTGTGTSYPTITLSSLPSGVDLCIVGATGREGAAGNTHTEDTDYTTFGFNGTTGSAATCTSMHGHFRTFGGTTDTISGTISTSQDIARVMVCLVPLYWPERLTLGPIFYTPTFEVEEGSPVLTADAGSFAEAGQAAGTLYGRAVTSDAGAIALAGQDAALNVGYAVVADASAFLCAGQDADVRWAHIFAADAEAFLLAGQDAALTYSTLTHYSLDSEAGSFALAGEQAGTLYGRTATLDAGAFALAGQDAGFLYGHALTSDAGAYALAGQDGDLRVAHTFSADAGGFTLAGQDAVFLYGYALPSDAGAVVLAGQDADLRSTRTLSADAGSFLLTGQDATLVYQPVGSYTLVADIGAFALAGQDADLAWARLFSSDAGSFSLAGQDAELTYTPSGDFVVPETYFPDLTLSWAAKATYIWALHPSSPLTPDKGDINLTDLSGTEGTNANNWLTVHGTSFKADTAYRFGDNPDPDLMIGGISVWVEFTQYTSPTGFQGLWGHGDSNYHCAAYLYEDGWVYTSLGNLQDYINQPSGMPLGVHHIVMQVYDTNTVRYWVDGVEYGGVTDFSTLTADPSDYLEVASSTGTSTHPIQNGAIRLYSVINGDNWTEAEILDMYENPAAYYQGEEPGATLSAEAGDFALDGQDAEFLRTYVVELDAGAIALSGQASVRIYNFIVPATYAPNLNPTWAQKADYIWALHPTHPLQADKGGNDLVDLSGTETVSAFNWLEVTTTQWQSSSSFRFGDNVDADKTIGGVSVWVTPNNLNAPADGILASGNAFESFGLFLLGANVHGFFQSNNRFVTDAISAGVPYHLVYQLRSDGIPEIYVNGVKSTLAVVTQAGLTAAPFDIAAGTVAVTQYFEGAIRLVAVLNGDIWTDAEVLDMYENPKDFYQKALVAETGAFTEVGQEAELRHAVILPAEELPLVLAGQTVDFLRSYVTTSETGLFVVDGQADLILSQGGVSDPATFTFGGQAADFLRSYVVPFDAGAYALAGQATGLLKGYKTAFDFGSFTLAGQDAAFLKVNAYPMLADAGAFSLAGQEALLLRGRVVTSDFGVFTLTGEAAGSIHLYRATSDTGPYLLAGPETALILSQGGVSDQAVFTLNGQAVNFLRGYVVPFDTGAFALAGQAANLIRTHQFVSDAGAFVFSGQQAGVLYGRTISVDTQSYVVGGQAAEFAHTYALLLDTGAFIFDASDTGLLRPLRFLVSTEGVFVLSGKDVEMMIDVLLEAPGRIYHIAKSLRILQIPAAPRIINVAADKRLMLVAPETDRYE